MKATEQKRALAASIDAAGNLFVASQMDHTLWQFAPEGVSAPIGGLPNAAGSTDAIGHDARFGSPSSIAVDADGRLYIADSRNNTIRVGEPNRLNVWLDGDSVVVTWPAAFTSFSLYSRPSLSPVDAWSLVPGTFPAAGGETTARIGVGSDAKFFRLRAP